VVRELEDADGNGRGEAITFVDANRMRLARYTDLSATDKRLDARMSVTAGRIALHVDDAGATYPVQVDPLMWVEAGEVHGGRRHRGRIAPPTRLSLLALNATPW
jgi:hypothetical protein